MSVEVELFDDLDAAEADAGGGLSRDAQPSLFDRIGWYRLLQNHVRPEGKPIVARARHGRRLAWMFLDVEDNRAHSWTSWYSLRWRPIGDADLVPHMLKALRDGRVPSLDFAPLEEPDALREACRAAGFIPFVRPATANWYAETDGQDFDTYWTRRPAKLRNTAARKARAAGLDVVVRTRFSAEAWDDYESVYRASWKPDEGAPAFLRALAEQEGAAGTLRLGLAYKDDRAIAAQLWLVENGEATIHKLAYREDAKALSPGTILSMHMFRHALDEDHVGRIDYGTGDEAYKADWMDAKRTLWRVTANNRRTLKGLAGAARAAASALVARLRSR